LPYCKECGEEVPAGSTFCPKCGARIGIDSRSGLATWGERLAAYLIDSILLGLILGFVTLPGLYWMPRMWSVPRFIPFVELGGRNVVNFIYWALMEGVYGQSLGKMAMRIEVVHVDGGPIDITRSAIQAAGKAFLLPLDCIIGWFVYPSSGKRLFNHLSETVVIRKRD